LIPANTLWVLVLAILVLYIVARWVRSHTVTEEEHPNEQVRYLIRSGTVSGGEQLGARSGLVVSRYYFRQTDVAAGPPDPADFYDELFIDLRDPDSQQTWQNSIHVATPRGLDRMMAEEHWDTVIGGELLIVRKYEVDKILQGAIDHLQEIYEVRVQLMGRRAEPPERV
jgi:hypothetical protein